MHGDYFCEGIGGILLWMTVSTLIQPSRKKVSWCYGVYICVKEQQNWFVFDTALFKQFLEKLLSSLSSHSWMEGWKNKSHLKFMKN